MTNYRIRVKVEIVEGGEANEAGFSRASADGCYEMTIAEKTAQSIDDCEKAMLLVNAEALRTAISEHLEAVSKKKPLGMAKRMK